MAPGYYLSCVFGNLTSLSTNASGIQNHQSAFDVFYHDAHERTPVCCMLCAFCSAWALRQTNDLSPLGTATSIPARLMNHLSSALKKIQNACTITEAQDEGEPSKRGWFSATLRLPGRRRQRGRGTSDTQNVVRSHIVYVRLDVDVNEDAAPRMHRT